LSQKFSNKLSFKRELYVLANPFNGAIWRLALVADLDAVNCKYLFRNEIRLSEKFWKSFSGK